MHVINRRDLPTSLFRGADHGASVSIILSDSPPGDGPRLHRHPYEEIWIVQQGDVQLWIGDETTRATEGDIAVAPPNAAHKFKNVGDGLARLICIHSSPTVTTEWLE
jgi:quercetin dioxygenase-like cupin family protein